VKNVLLKLEFAPQAPTKISLGSTVLLLAALLLFSLAAAKVGHQIYLNAAQTTNLAMLSSSRKATTVPAIVRAPRLDPADAARAQYVRQTSRKLTTPWGDLLTALETVPSGIALINVDPSASKGSVAVTAEAAGSAEMLDYLASLQSDQRLANVVLVSHQVQLQAPGTPIRFQLRASWGVAP